MNNFKINYSYKQGFKNLWRHLQNKYDQQLFDIDGVGKQLDLADFSKTFFKTKDSATSDVSVDSNANVCDNSVISYANEWGKPLERFNSYYLIWDKITDLFGKEIADKVVESNLTGDIYINDFHGISTGKPYCYNYSTYDICLNGLPFVNKIKSYAPKYLYGFKSQVEQFIIIASNSTLGATGLADLLIVMSLYVENILDNLSDGHFKFASIEDCWSYVKETIISLIYTLNQPMRGSQSPFTNVSVFDRYFAQSLSETYVHPKTGKQVNVDILNKIQEMYLDCMNEELERTPITFPVTTACFSIDENKEIVDKDFLSMISEKSLKYGFINFYIGKTSTLSSCCRLRSEMKNEYFNAFGSGGTKIGSLGVCTVNYPRIAYLSKNESDFKERLEDLVKLSFYINYAKRKILEDRIKGGFHPLYTHGFINIDTQYLTLGVNGFNETIEIMGYNPLSEDGILFGKSMIKWANDINDQLGKEYKTPTNCEQIPAENVSIKLAAKDMFMKYNNGEYELYSNQFIPLVSDATLLDRIKLQGIYDESFSGGSIAHLNVGQKIDDKNKIESLIKVCAKRGVIYFAINYLLLELEDGSMVVGNKNMVEVNGKKVVNSYTRVVGFLTNTKHWHKKRRELDFPNRKFYDGI